MNVWIVLVETSSSAPTVTTHKTQDIAYKHAAEACRDDIDANYNIMINSNNQEFFDYHGETIYLPKDDRKLVDEVFEEVSYDLGITVRIFETEVHNG